MRATKTKCMWKNLYTKRLESKCPKPKLTVGDRVRQQEVSSVQEKVFTRADRGSVLGGSSDVGSGAFVKDQRMRWNTFEWYVLHP